jgi:hypothetical protein
MFDGEGQHASDYKDMAQKPEGPLELLWHQKRATLDLNRMRAAAERELLAEILAHGATDYDEAEEERSKRWWGGNKHKDNKSYGFWITALNKAGNYKRGKRSAPFVPGMGSLEDDHNPLTGSADYSNVSELVPDRMISVTQ